MNSSTRDQLFAAKERLHQLTEKARGEEGKRAAQEQREKNQAEEAAVIQRQNKEKILAEKEKARVRARAQEEETYLKQHNKTVRQALSQAAKFSRGAGDEEEEDGDGSEEDEEEDDSEPGSQIDQREGQQDPPTSRDSGAVTNKPKS